MTLLSMESNYSILNRELSNYIYRYVIIVIIIFFFLSIARRSTIPHADQLRAVSTARYRLSHGKAWHVLRWCVRFLIRVVSILELTIRFNLSFPCFCSVTIHSERCNIRNSSNMLTPSMIISNTDQKDGKGQGVGGGRDSHMKGAGMLVVSLRGVNFSMWPRLGCSVQNTIIFSRKGLF